MMRLSLFPSQVDSGLRSAYCASGAHALHVFTACFEGWDAVGKRKQVARHMIRFWLGRNPEGKVFVQRCVSTSKGASQVWVDNTGLGLVIAILIHLF